MRALATRPPRRQSGAEHSTHGSEAPTLESSAARTAVGLGHDLGTMSVLPPEAAQRDAAPPTTDGASAGQQLPEATRAKMEGALDADFSTVRVHQDGQAEQLSANAYASGDELHFAEGKYDPHSQSGQALLGHELAHVVQQRDGRVDATASSGVANVVDDPALEDEARAQGQQAAASSTPAPAAQPALAPVSAPAAQRDAVVQREPVSLTLGAVTGLGMLIESLTLVEAAELTGAIVGGGVVGGEKLSAAVTPGTDGVQSVSLKNRWMTPADEQKLELVTQYKLIDLLSTRVWQQHPELKPAKPGPTPTAPPPTPTVPAGTAPTPPAPAGATPTPPAATTTPVPTTPPPTPAPAPTPTPATPPGATAAPPTPAAPAGDKDKKDDPLADVNAAMVKAISAQAKIEIEELFKQKEGKTQEFIWSDSGDHTADIIGTVGAVAFRNTIGAALRYTLALGPDAMLVPGLNPPMKGKEMIVTQFRGGVMNQGDSMDVGYGDNLAINLSGGEINVGDTDGNNRHGVHRIQTEWVWDGNRTHWTFKHFVTEDGTPVVEAEPSEGTPKDYSGSRAMPWNWAG